MDRLKTASCGSLSFSIGMSKDTAGTYVSLTQIRIYTSARLTFLMKVGHSAGSAAKMKFVRRYSSYKPHYSLWGGLCCLCVQVTPLEVVNYARLPFYLGCVS